MVSKSESVVADKAKSFMSKQSTGVGKRAFLSVAEICELSRDGSIILFADHQPIYANKFPYVLHPDAEKMENTLPEDVIDFSDKAGRQILRQAEESYRQQFWETHEMYPDMEYKDISDAMLTKPPETPASMIAAMLQDDWRRARQFVSHHKILEELLKPQAANGDRQNPTDGTKCNESAEKGTFKTFYEEYRNHGNGHHSQYFDLTFEIEDHDGGYPAYGRRNEEPAFDVGNDRSDQHDKEGNLPTEAQLLAVVSPQLGQHEVITGDKRFEWKSLMAQTKEMKDLQNVVTEGTLPKGKRDGKKI